MTGGAPAPLRRRLAAPDQSWLELFYDLVFVAAILVLSSSYSKDSSPAQVAWLGLVFAMIWSTWLATTMLTNRVRLEGTMLRSLLVLQMAGVLALVLTADDHLADDTGWTGPVFAGVLVVTAALYHLVRRDHPELSAAFRHRAARTLVVAALFLATPLVPGNGYAVVWLVAIAVLVLPARRHRPPVDAHHLVHRFGELTIIILGETFVKIGLVATEEPLADLDLWVLPMAFVLVFALWWPYFTDVPAGGLPEGGAGRTTAWTLLHLPLHLAVVGLAVGVAKLLVAHAPASGHAPGGIRFMSFPLLVFGAAMIGLDVVAGTDDHCRRAWIHTWTCVAIVVVLAVGVGFRHLPAEPIAVTLTVVMVAAAMATRRFALREPVGTGDGGRRRSGAGSSPAG